MRRLPSTPFLLVAALVGVVALALAVDGPHQRAAAAGVCSASVVAADQPDTVLSTALAIEITCDEGADVEVRAPGSDVTTRRVAAGSSVLLEDERAYLCEGDDAVVELSAAALGWSETVEIAGLGALPRCDVLLKAGVTELHWTGLRTPLARAFVGDSFSAGPAARGITGVVPGLSVWSIVDDAPWSWSGWGDGVPALLYGLDALVPGNDYLIVSDVERAWTFPQPSADPSPFENAQVVSFYGYPGIPVMGALGAYSPEVAADEISSWAERYDRLNGPRGVVPAFHLLVAVAQPTAQRDGSHLYRIPDELLHTYVETAREHGMLLFLDVQIGWSDPLAEVKRLEDVLREPFVHLALDPEFATERFDEVPGKVIGAVDAGQVNEVQEYLAGLVAEEGIPPKILIVHQFLERMIQDREAIERVPEVDLTIDMDGFGSDRLKLEKYDRFALTAPADRAAIKLFFQWDTPLISPQRLLSLDRPPDLIIYQ